MFSDLIDVSEEVSTDSLKLPQKSVRCYKNLVFFLLLIEAFNSDIHGWTVVDLG